MNKLYQSVGIITIVLFVFFILLQIPSMFAYTSNYLEECCTAEYQNVTELFEECENLRPAIRRALSDKFLSKHEYEQIKNQHDSYYVDLKFNTTKKEAIETVSNTIPVEAELK